MKKILALVLFLASVTYAVAQPVTRRSLPVNTVSDARLQAQYNFFLPRYSDTTAANLAIGIDSCGAKIFTYEGNAEWVRGCSPKRWIKSGASIVTDNTETVTLSGVGDASDPLTAEVNLSTTGNNALQALPDGLYVPNTIRNGVVWGGQVVWVSGYTYTVTAAGYYIVGTYYTSPETSVTLSPADNDSSRIDLFAVNTSSTVEVIEGEPSDNPAEPSVDAGTQLRLSIALVEAGTTEPTNNGTGLRRECIYKENTEWTAVASTARINPNSTTSPCVGTKAVEATSAVNGDYVTFTRSGAITILDSFAVLTFQIKPKANWGSNRRLQLRWYNGATAVGVTVNISGSSYGFSSNLLTCQTVAIPLADFGLAATTSITALRIAVAANNGSIGWYLDELCLQNQEQPTYNTPITLQNGLTLTASTNIGELGGTLLHNTTNYTGYYVHTLSGATVYNYPYQFQQAQNFGSSTSVASFKNTGAVYNTSADYNNAVRLGINYTSDVYNTSPATEGYFGDRIGYMLNTNLRGHGSFGLYQDDSSAKNVGIFFHTKDNSYTDGVTIFAGAATNTTGDYSLTGLKTHKVAIFKTNQSIQLPGYGAGTKTGTETYRLAVDASGNVIEVLAAASGVTSVGLSMPSAFTVTGSPVTSSGTLAVTGAGTTAQYIRGDGSLAAFPTTISGITADNGLTASTSTNAQWGSTTSSGSPLLHDTYINQGAFITRFNTANTNGSLYAVNIDNTGAGGALGVTTNSGASALGVNNSNIGDALTATASSGRGIVASSTSGKAARFLVNPSSTNTIATVLEAARISSGTAATGIGGAFDFRLETDNGTERLSNQLISKWTGVTDATRTSQFIIAGVNSATTVDMLTLGGEGYMKLNSITATAASAITASAGMVVFVNSTNGTFTSVGFWGYDGTAWAKF